VKKHVFLPLVAASLAAVAFPNKLLAQSDNVKTPNKNASAKFKSAIYTGSGNSIGSNSVASLVGGGQSNSISGGAANAVVSGGFNNAVGGSFATVSGGIFNRGNGEEATVGGGRFNAANGEYSTVAGGWSNAAVNVSDSVGGGCFNTVTGGWATVAGGWTNRADGLISAIGGGSNNVATGLYATVPGGALGRATNDGSFVWGDGTEITGSFGNNTFAVRATGGVRLYTAPGTGTGVEIPAGSGAWTSLSDRNAKENFSSVDPSEVLARVASMPVMTWNYKSQDEGIRHIGPTAQDFRKAFGVGESETGITTVDADGVALAAIQGLVEELRLRDARHIEDLAARDRMIEALERKLDRVEKRLGSLPLDQ